MRRALVSLLFMAMASLAYAEEASQPQEESLPKKVGDGVKQGGEAAGRGIEKGGEAVVRGVKKGVEATVEGVKKAEVWVGKKLQKGGEKLEKAGE